MSATEMTSNPVDKSKSPLQMFSDLEKLGKQYLLQETELNLLRGVLNSSLSGIMVFTSVRNERGEIVDFIYRLVNHKAAEIMGRPAEELIGKQMLDVLPGHLESGLFNIYVQVVETGKTIENEFYYQHEWIRSWFQNIATPLQDGFVVTFNDITERKKTEQHLRLQEERLRVATGAGKIGTWDWNLVTGELIWDERMMEIYGYSREEFSGYFEFWRQAVFAADLDRVEKELQECSETGKDFDSSFRIRTPDGSIRYIDARARVIMNGEIAERMVGVNIDATELHEYRRILEEKVEREIGRRREHEQILIHQSRMAALGEMMGAIAHQWRQPLNGLGLILQDLEEAQKYGELDEAYMKKAAADALTLLQHMSSTIDDFRNFFKPRTNNESFSIRELISATQNLFSGQLHANQISFEISGNETYDRIHGNRNQLQQCILNLISNSIDAVKEISNRGTARRILFTIENRPEWIDIHCWNNGPPVNESILPKIFDPYFTTKEQGKGTGIGLYMTKTIIENNFHGFVSATNPADGFQITISIPETGQYTSGEENGSSDMERMYS